MAQINPIVTINGVSLDSSQIAQYKLTYNKLWKNANRNMDGVVTATLIGIYPNISLTTRSLSFGEAMALSNAVNTDYFTVTFWDTQTSTHKSAVYYAADHEVEFLSECRYGQVTIDLVAKSRGI